MSTKLKALGLALVAALAVGAVSVVSATATTGGHFTSDAPEEWTHVSGGQEGSLHDNVLIDHDLGESVTCSTVTYTANIAGASVTQVDVAPNYGGCELTSGLSAAVIDTKGCVLRGTIGPNPATVDQTAHLVCTGSNEVTITIDPPVFGSCVVHIPPQTPTSGGVVYTPTTTEGKDSLTLDITAQGITNNKTEIGFLGCLGAGGEGNNSTLIGKATAQGKSTAGNPVNVKATGP